MGRVIIDQPTTPVTAARLTALINPVGDVGVDFILNRIALRHPPFLG
jgi:hypothetical protein